MTLEELKKDYRALSKMHIKRGDLCHAKGDEKLVQGSFKKARILYDMAAEEYQQAIRYIEFVNDLNKVTK